MYARIYARIIGVVLIAVGIVGLVLGNRVWLGLLNVDILEDVVHLITGGVFAYVGFGPLPVGIVRAVVGVLGIIYLAVGVLWASWCPACSGSSPTATPSSTTCCTWPWGSRASRSGSSLAQGRRGARARRGGVGAP